MSKEQFKMADDFYPDPDTIKELENIYDDYGTMDCVGDSSDLNKDWNVKLVEKCGGSEGEGETHFIVLKFTNNKTNEELFFKIPGWYQSYDGAYLYWDQARKVFPREKTIVVYE